MKLSKEGIKLNSVAYSYGGAGCGGVQVEGFPDGASGKEPACQCRRHKRLGFDPWVGKIPKDGMATYSSILAWRIPEDRGACQATVHRVAKSWI